MLSIFPLLGLSVFERTESNRSPKHLLYLNAKGIAAKAYEDAKGFIVLKGSQMVRDEVPSIHPYMSTIRKDLLEQGIVSGQNGAA